MILLICLWQQNLLQSILAFASWTILHMFFIVSLSHITVAGHMGGCCQKNGCRNMEPCRQKMIESVRALLDFTYSVIIPVWGGFLLAASQYDVESHSFLYIASLGYHSYATYWALKDATFNRGRSYGYINQHESPNIVVKNKLLRLTQSVLATAIVAFGVRALSTEMSNWRNTVVPLMMDLHPSSTWSHPTSIQRKALSHHLLTKNSEVAWLITFNLLVHELPNIFYNLQRLMRLSSFRGDHIKQCAWTTDDYKTNVESAACLGAAAWRREHGITASPSLVQNYTITTLLSKIHRITFVICRIIGGFIALNRILMTEHLVRDTTYVASALLFHGMAVYLFGGIISYTAKALSRTNQRALKKSLSWQLATSMNDDWLR